MGYYWPPSVPRSVLITVEAMIQVYATMGFVSCETAALEVGFEKIAIYGTHGIAEHAARQTPTGRWTSKLGLHEDIEHDTLEVVSGGEYGKVAALLKRALQEAAAPSKGQTPGMAR